MNEIGKIPQSFWGLFQSQNRYIYMESLMLLYDEYLFNDYFLTRETCVQLLADYFSNRLVDISADEEEDEVDQSEPMATRILYRLIRFSWVKRLEDYSSFTTNIVIPEYASAFIEVFKRLNQPDSNDTDLYIQNVYTNLYSFYHDSKAGVELLKTALVNTTKVNRALQSLLHNMDRFFHSLLEKKNYEELLDEHLDVYVETIVNKKYSLLKTSDNFYIYKNDIKQLLRQMKEEQSRLTACKNKRMAEGYREEEVEEEILNCMDGMERGIANMEKRIAHIDNEHGKYVRATVSRLEYLLSNDENSKGNIVKLLNRMSQESVEDIFEKTANIVQIHDMSLLSYDAFYKKRGKRRPFQETIEAEEETSTELSRDEILKLNHNRSKYGKTQMKAFIETRMEQGVLDTANVEIKTEEEFELLILSYDYSIRKQSPFQVERIEEEKIQNGIFTYPRLRFEKKEKAQGESNGIL